jgi:hypothetical protein
MSPTARKGTEPGGAVVETLEASASTPAALEQGAGSRNRLQVDARTAT